VVILEDLDTIIESYGESDLLPLLDGENQVDNVVFVATTNYLSDLDDRIVNRPSRFDIVREVEFPTDEARKKFIEMKIPRLKKKKNTIEVTVLDDGKISKKKVDEMEWIVAETKGLAISHLKEYVIASEMLGNSREAVIKRLKKMQGKKFVGGEM
jgi:SpoVK/Ycf46/Vps4 family AAA+-type ATPase